MGLRKMFRDFRDWCPQPPACNSSKLKHYSAPIAMVLTATLLAASFSVFYSGFQASPSLPQVVIPLAESASAIETAPAVQWVQQYTGQYPGDYADRIIQTSDGGYVIAGVAGAHLYSVAAVWLVKIGSRGNVEWNRTFSFTSGSLTYNLESVAGFVQTGDGGFAIAGTEAWFPSNNTLFEYATGSEGVLFKLDSLGNVEWNQTYPNIGGIASMVQTSDGYALASGYSLMETNSLDIVQWQKSYEASIFKPNTLNENLASVVQTSDDGYALLTSDNILFKVNPSGDLQWKQTYELGTANSDAQGTINSFIESSDGGYLLACNVYPENSGNNYASLIKTDAKGSVEWSKTYGPAGSSANALIQTSDGGYAFAGIVPGQGNYPQNYVWLVKTDSSGKLQWSQNNNNTAIGLSLSSLGSSFSVSSLIETNDGGLMIVGSYNSEPIVETANHYYLVKTDPALTTPTPIPPSTQMPSPSPAPATLLPSLVLVASLAAVAAVIVVTIVILVKRTKNRQRNKSTDAKDNEGTSFLSCYQPCLIVDAVVGCLLFFSLFWCLNLLSLTTLPSTLAQWVLFSPLLFTNLFTILNNS